MLGWRVGLLKHRRAGHPMRCKIREGVVCPSRKCMAGIGGSASSAGIPKLPDTRVREKATPLLGCGLAVGRDHGNPDDVHADVNARVVLLDGLGHRTGGIEATRSCMRYERNQGWLVPCLVDPSLQWRGRFGERNQLPRQLCLLRRTLVRAIRAEHTAVTRSWLNSAATFWAVPVSNAGVGRHGLLLLETTSRAANGGLRLKHSDIISLVGLSVSHTVTYVAGPPISNADTYRRQASTNATPKGINVMAFIPL